jgi:hypothetical protein
MRANSLLVVAGGVACLFTVSTLLARQPAKPGNGGTDILHWAVRKAMTNEDTNSNAKATVDMKQNTQGRANNQRIDLRIRDLTTNTAYQLWALIGDDTNYVHAADFTTDNSGNAKLKYMFVGSSQGHGHGRGKKALPGDLNPISQLSGLAIGIASTQAVFTANLLAPDKLNYLIKRRLTEDDITADLRLKATQSKLQFRLYVWGLSPTNDYHLVLNDALVSSGSSSTNGNLSFESLPVNASDILNVRSLSLIDSATNIVLSTTLP